MIELDTRYLISDLDIIRLFEQGLSKERLVRLVSERNSLKPEQARYAVENALINDMFKNMVKDI